jgi:plasmid maintenance system antidote protein VapI
VSEIVRHLLGKHGVSVNAFAKQQGIAQSALSDMLRGKRDWSKSVIIRVADYFKLDRGMFLR